MIIKVIKIFIATQKKKMDESSSEEMLNLIFLKEFYVLCPECGGNYLFKLHNLEYMNVECQCKYIRYCTFMLFFFNYRIP